MHQKAATTIDLFLYGISIFIYTFYACARRYLLLTDGIDKFDACFLLRSPFYYVAHFLKDTQNKIHCGIEKEWRKRFIDKYIFLILYIRLIILSNSNFCSSRCIYIYSYRFIIHAASNTAYWISVSIFLKYHHCPFLCDNNISFQEKIKYIFVMVKIEQIHFSKI